MAHKHSVYDTDSHFQINAVTRAIVNVSQSKVSLMQYDHDSERFTFEMPRKIDGHDMMLCDVVQVHYINIDARDKTQTSKDVYEVGDLQISPESDDVVICSWLISGNATKYAGALSFLLKFKCTDDDGSVVYVWNTATHTGISVSSGIDNGESVVAEFSDVLEAWKAEVVADSKAEILASVDSEIEAKTAEAFDKIEEKASEAVTAAAEKQLDKYANALKGTASGEAIAITDASPIEHEMGVKVWGRNLWPETALKLNANGGEMSQLGSFGYDENEQKITLTEDAISNYAGVYSTPFSFVEADKYYTFSCEIRGTAGKTAQIGWLNAKKKVQLTEEYQRITASIAGSRLVSGICFYSDKTADGGLANGEWMQFRNVQIEEGATATDYAPYVEDISAVKVKKYGKNIVDNDKLQNADNWLPIADGSGNLTRGLFLLGLKANTSYTISWGTNNAALIFFKLVSFPKGQASNQDIYTSEASLISSGIPVGYTFTTASDKEYGLFITQLTEMVTYIDYMQVEVGTAATAYEPYNATEYAVTTDGTVEGVTPIYPTTTLMTDTAGAVIDCTYNRDINKAFAELQSIVNALVGG